jgi:hypothetical protein
MNYGIKSEEVPPISYRISKFLEGLVMPEFALPATDGHHQGKALAPHALVPHQTPSLASRNSNFLRATPGPERDGRILNPELTTTLSAVLLTSIEI